MACHTAKNILETSNDQMEKIVQLRHVASFFVIGALKDALKTMRQTFETSLDSDVIRKNFNDAAILMSACGDFIDGVEQFGNFLKEGIFAEICMFGTLTQLANNMATDSNDCLDDEKAKRFNNIITASLIYIDAFDHQGMHCSNYFGQLLLQDQKENS